MLVEPDTLDIETETAEGVEIAVADLGPVGEFNAKFIGAGGRCEELRLVDAEHCVEGADRGNRRFPDAHGTDRVRFDQRDAHPRGNEPRERRRRHPARSTAADDHDPADGCTKLHAATPA
ncbi:hypothetical protein QFZ54_000582 [Sphingomonas faeni]|nr:hypothetical protein [Sphingomonas faeni]